MKWGVWKLVTRGLEMGQFKRTLEEITVKDQQGSSAGPTQLAETQAWYISANSLPRDSEEPRHYKCVEGR